MWNRLQSRLIALLRRSEKYTKTDMVWLASGGVLSLAYQGTNIVASLLLAVAVGHLVPPAIYGQYKYVLSVIAILSFFSLNGLGSAVTQSTANGFDGALRQGFWINIRWSVLIFLAGLGFSIYYLVLGNIVLAVGIMIGATFSPILASANLYTSFLAGKRDFVRQISYSILDNIIPIAIFIGTIFITQDPIVLIGAYFAANALATLFFYFRTIEVYRPDHANDDPKLVHYSAHLSIMGVIGGIADNLDQILLFHYVGAAQLAVYNFATTIPDQIKGPLKMVEAMILSRFSSGDPKSIRASMGNKYFWFFVFTGSATVVYLVFAPLVFNFFFPIYADAIGYSRLYALWMVSATFDASSVYLLAKKKIREQYITSVSLSLFQIGSMVVGVAYAGMVGLIVARILTKWFFAAISLVLYGRAIRADTEAA